MFGKKTEYYIKERDDNSVSVTTARTWFSHELLIYISVGSCTRSFSRCHPSSSLTCDSVRPTAWRCKTSGEGNRGVFLFFLLKNKSFLLNEGLENKKKKTKRKRVCCVSRCVFQMFQVRARPSSTTASLYSRRPNLYTYVRACVGECGVSLLSFYFYFFFLPKTFLFLLCVFPLKYIRRLAH